MTLDVVKSSGVHYTAEETSAVVHSVAAEEVVAGNNSLGVERWFAGEEEDNVAEFE